MKNETTLGVYPYIEDKEFSIKTFLKKEFYDPMVGKVIPTLKKHQSLIARFMTLVTPYQEMLLFHEMGTGKTRTSLAVAEAMNRLQGEQLASSVFVGRKFFYYKDAKRNIATITRLLSKNSIQIQYTTWSGRQPKKKSHQIDIDSINVPSPGKIRKVYVLSKNKNIQKVFLTELRKMYPTEKNIKNRIKRFTFKTFNEFNSIIRIVKRTKDYPYFDNSLFIIDEAHNLIPFGTKSQQKYQDLSNLKVFFEKVKNRRILIMTGTPMMNSPTDILHLINLMLPVGKKIKIWKDNEIIDNDSNITKQFLDEFTEAIKGRVSYLKQSSKVTSSVNQGEIRDPFSKFKLNYLVMSTFQTKAFLALKDNVDLGIEKQQASLFVFPNRDKDKDATVGLIGKKGLENWNKNTTRRQKHELLFKHKKLEEYSCKYADIIKTVQAGPYPVFIYCNVIVGGGLEMLQQIFELLDYKQMETAAGSPNSYILFTGSNTPSEEIITAFNSKDNKDGKLCKVIMGSKAASEGYTFRNIKTEIIASPFWNNAETLQAIARGVRLNSHDDTDDTFHVKIRKLVAVPGKTTGKTNFGDDVKRYKKSEDKDILNKKVEHIIKEYAFDCAFNKADNYRDNKDYDKTADCEYTDCNYECAGVVNQTINAISEGKDALDTTTFDRYYSIPHIEAIKLLFSTRDLMTLEDIVTETKLDEYTVLQTINTLITTREAIAKRHEKSCYLGYLGNLFFITTEVIQNGIMTFAGVYNTKYPSLSTDMTFAKWSSQINNEKADSVLQRLLDSDNNEKKNESFFTYQKNYKNISECPPVASLKLSIQEKLLESAILYVQRHGRGDDVYKLKQAERIKNYYSLAIIRQPDKEVKIDEGEADVPTGTEKIQSSLLFSLNGGKLRILDKDEWRDATYDETTNFKRLHKQKISTLQLQTYMTRNFISTSCKTCIVPCKTSIVMKIDNNKNRKVKNDSDKRLINPGKVSVSFNEDDLLLMLFEEIPKMGDEEKNKMKETIRQMGLKMISKTKCSKGLGQTRVDFTTKVVPQLLRRKRIKYDKVIKKIKLDTILNLVSVNELCVLLHSKKIGVIKLLQEYFSSTNRIVISIDCGIPSKKTRSSKKPL